MIEVSGKYHGYLMTLDTSDQLDRTGYFLGRFYDLATQQFMRETVSPGDTFVDIGANIGMLTLLAARLVGPRGKVIAFEPNADVYRQLQHHVHRNKLENVSINPVGLGDIEKSLTLKVWAKNKGWGTFGTLSSEEQGLLTAEYQSRVVLGDNVLEISSGTPTIIKIDVEGFECQVLRGLAKTLRAHRPTIITELIPENLARGGSSPAELFEIMETYHYQPFALDIARNNLRYCLSLKAISREENLASTNVVWVHPESPQFKRIPVKAFR
jgi:FkbM family methyltransferase